MDKKHTFTQAPMPWKTTKECPFLSTSLFCVQKLSKYQQEGMDSGSSWRKNPWNLQCRFTALLDSAAKTPLIPSTDILHYHTMESLRNYLAHLSEMKDKKWSYNHYIYQMIQQLSRKPIKSFIQTILSTLAWVGVTLPYAHNIIRFISQ